MDNKEMPAVYLILSEVLKQLNDGQEAILERINSIKTESKPTASYITAVEFMEALRIRRSKFDELRHNNLIKTIEKGRKIYVPIEEVNRYFQDPKIK